MRNTPDKAIIERAKRDEAQALEEIFDSYSPGIYRYAFRLLGDPELARECMAETFNRFLNALKRDGGPDNYLQAYLYRISHNWVTDHYRCRGLPAIPLDSVILADSEDEPGRIVADQMSSRQLREALALLTPDQRQVVTLKYLEEWENEAIARALNKPVGAVKSLQHRALASLRRILGRQEDYNA
jgi:RNA polymerase sigma-70 factor (ECF subfamily)